VHHRPEAGAVHVGHAGQVDEQVFLPLLEQAADLVRQLLGARADRDGPSTSECTRRGALEIVI
jgi:hypothetical protein